MIDYPKPNDYFHLFVNNSKELEEYLLFLIELSQKTKIPNEKVVYHNIFEFYIQKYEEYLRLNKKVLEFRDLEDI